MALPNDNLLPPDAEAMRREQMQQRRFERLLEELQQQQERSRQVLERLKQEELLEQQRHPAGPPDGHPLRGATYRDAIEGQENKTRWGLNFDAGYLAGESPWRDAAPPPPLAKQPPRGPQPASPPSMNAPPDGYRAPPPPQPRYGTPEYWALQPEGAPEPDNPLRGASFRDAIANQGLWKRNINADMSAEWGIPESRQLMMGEVMPRTNPVPRRAGSMPMPTTASAPVSDLIDLLLNRR